MDIILKYGVTNSFLYPKLTRVIFRIQADYYICYITAQEPYTIILSKEIITMNKIGIYLPEKEENNLKNYPIKYIFDNITTTTYSENQNIILPAIKSYLRSEKIMKFNESIINM